MASGASVSKASRVGAHRSDFGLSQSSEVIGHRFEQLLRGLAAANRNRNGFPRRDILAGPDATNRPDHLLEFSKLPFDRFVVMIGLGLRPGREHRELGGFRAEREVRAAGRHRFKHSQIASVTNGMVGCNKSKQLVQSVCHHRLGDRPLVSDPPVAVWRSRHRSYRIHPRQSRRGCATPRQSDNASSPSVTCSVTVDNRLSNQRSSSGRSSIAMTCGLYPSMFISTNLAAFHSLLTKLRAVSKRSLTTAPLGNALSSSDSAHWVENGFLQAGHSNGRERSILFGLVDQLVTVRALVLNGHPHVLRVGRQPGQAEPQAHRVQTCRSRQSGRHRCPCSCSSFRPVHPESWDG